MQPSYLYESPPLPAAGAWLCLRAMRTTPMPAWMREGDLCKLFPLTYACARFLLEYERGHPPMLFRLRGSQVAVLAAIVLRSIHAASRA